jgi:hypothetical protein
MIGSKENVGGEVVIFWDKSSMVKVVIFWDEGSTYYFRAYGSTSSKHSHPLPLLSILYGS